MNERIYRRNCPICEGLMEYSHDWRVWLHIGRTLGFCPVTGGTTR